VAAVSIFKVENLTYYYPEAKKPALQNINTTIEEGEFLLITGGSGCGKSSLARALAGLIPDFYGGTIGGTVLFRDQNIRAMDRRALARQAGIVFQDPEKQLVMTGVEAEIAFGLENLGLAQQEMFRRVAEVMNFLGLNSFKAELTANLSGGQKQKLALGSVLAMQPYALILDEPTSQLDPVVAEDLFNLIKRLNEEMNLTIILIEQRLERCFHLADRVLVMENGRIIQAGTPGEVASWQVKEGLPFVPRVAAFFAHAGFADIPLTVKEGRKRLDEVSFSGSGAGKHVLNQAQQKKAAAGPVVDVKNLWFTYPNGREVLRGINLTAWAGEFVTVLGGNASGKTTLLKNLTGLLKPGRGKVMVLGNEPGQTPPQKLARIIGYLSQNPNDYLFQDTVEEELKFTLANLDLANAGNVVQLLERLDLGRYRMTNPRDLSSGERQRVALASVLVAGPKLLVLDEPTRGIDYRLKAVLGDVLQKLAEEGVTIILVTHDVEFAAEYADRTVMLFDGQIACDGPKHAVLGSSMFYSPQIGRLFRGYDDSVLTLREAVQKIQLVPAWQTTGEAG
jgi:energy-coupling factor transport system ATP-binding protein